MDSNKITGKAKSDFILTSLVQKTELSLNVDVLYRNIGRLLYEKYQS